MRTKFRDFSIIPRCILRKTWYTEIFSEKVLFLYNTYPKVFIIHSVLCIYTLLDPLYLPLLNLLKNFKTPFCSLYIRTCAPTLIYTHRNVDLSMPCDPVNFGNIMFYAVCMKKYDMIDVIHNLGVSAAAG